MRAGRYEMRENVAACVQRPVSLDATRTPWWPFAHGGAL